MKKTEAIKIVKSESSHIEGIINLIQQYKAETRAKVPPDFESRLKVIFTELFSAGSSTFSGGSYAYTALENGRVVGFINAHSIPFPLLISREMYISDLIVDSNTRGRGIGRQLMLEVEKKARELGCIRLMLNNKKTIESYKRRFYEKEGFTERTEFANFIKPLK